MPNKKKQCKCCKKSLPVTDKEIQSNNGWFADYSHLQTWLKDDAHKKQQKRIQQSIKDNGEAWEKMQIKPKRVQKSGADLTRKEWFDKLQKVLNQWVVHVRDKDLGCCTCDTNSKRIKYDAGHFFTRGARSDIRFEETNIHKQCSMNCNVHGSGMRNEYEKFIIEKYGQEHLDWLTLRKPDLKQQYPHWTDIETQVKHYRKLLREAGLKPHV